MKPTDELDEILQNFDTRCPKCKGEGHGGDGCSFCWSHNTTQDAIDQAKAAIQALVNDFAIKELEKVLLHGNGGGNWRRLLNLRIEALKMGKYPPLKATQGESDG